MKELRITIGDASGLLESAAKRTGQITCVQKQGKAKAGDVARIILKGEFHRTDMGLFRLHSFRFRDGWDMEKNRGLYVWRKE